MRKHCIIGAGYCGLGVAKSFLDHGIEFDWFERNSDIGGNWLNGVYDSTHIISSRDTTGYKEFPMPRDYPDFPSRAQMLDYLRSYADHFKLRGLIRFNTEVAAVTPVDDDKSGLSGWRVRLQNGETHVYAGVIVANGHHWDKRIPNYPGRFDGKTIHTKDYKNAADFEGSRVLVVGAGNSGCDLAVEAAGQGLQTWMSMRRGYYFLPKTLFGVPVAELDRPGLPVWAQKTLIKGALKLVVGSNSRYGLQAPDHDLFEHHPIVNSQLLYFIRHGKIKPMPDIKSFEGKTVHFADGSQIDVDTIVWATGFNISFPFLDSTYFKWRDGIPARIGGFMPPGMAGLYIFGLGQPRGGAGPLISASAELLSLMVLAQRDLKRPLAVELGRFTKPDTSYYVGVQESFRRVKAGKLLVKLIAPRSHGRLKSQPEPQVTAPRARTSKLGAAPPVRNPRFTFDSVPRHWYFGRPLQTHQANAYSLLFPEGERFFIRSVRAYADRVTDPVLREHVKAFVAQEAVHGREHEHHRELLRAQGFDPSRFIAFYDRIAFQKFEKLASRRLRLAVTAAMEHYTATLATQALTTPFLRDHAHPVMRDLFVWHSVEEIEHKSVAFDLLAEVAPGYANRAAGLISATVFLTAFRLTAEIDLIRQDKDATLPRLLGDYAAGVKDRFFLNGTFLKAAYRYLKPGFHPSQVDDAQLARDAMAELERRYEPLRPVARPESSLKPPRASSPDSDRAARA